MKNNKNSRKGFGKQLVGGVIYSLLACVVVAVSVNTTLSLLSKNDIELPETMPQNTNLELPGIADIPKITLPDISLDLSYDTPSPEQVESAPVADLPQGVDSVITDAEEPQNISDSPVIPENAVLGFDKFIKPCDGYVAKEHSVELPVYSTTLSDYRVHTGIDVTGEIGTPVACVNGGVVTDIFDDDLYGTTVCIKNRDGYTTKYSNLLPTLNADILVGAVITTGQIIGGIGDTALSEAIDPPHLHLEIYDSNGNAIDPEDLISF